MKDDAQQPLAQDPKNQDLSAFPVPEYSAYPGMTKLEHAVLELLKAKRAKVSVYDMQLSYGDALEKPKATFKPNPGAQNFLDLDIRNSIFEAKRMFELLEEGEQEPHGEG